MDDRNHEVTVCERQVLCRSGLVVTFRQEKSDLWGERLSGEGRGSYYWFPFIKFKAPAQLSRCWCNLALGASQLQQGPHHQT